MSTLARAVFQTCRQLAAISGLPLRDYLDLQYLSTSLSVLLVFGCTKTIISKSTLQYILLYCIKLAMTL